MVLLAVLEFENGSREEEFLLFFMSQRGDFRMVGVACVVLRSRSGAEESQRMENRR